MFEENKQNALEITEATLQDLNSKETQNVFEAADKNYLDAPPIRNISLMKNSHTALLMIDIQNDFCPGGALAVSDGDGVVDVVNAMQDDYPILVLTQDWHPADHSSFAANHENGEPFSMIKMPYGDQVLWPTHCVQGSKGAQFHDRLKTDGADMIIRKGYKLPN